MKTFRRESCEWTLYISTQSSGKQSLESSQNISTSVEMQLTPISGDRKIPDWPLTSIGFTCMYAFHKKRKNNLLSNNCQKKVLIDLPQSELEYSCFLLFEGDAREINKQMKFFSDQSDPTPLTTPLHTNIKEIQTLKERQARHLAFLLLLFV